MKETSNKNSKLSVDGDRLVVFHCFDDFRDWYLRNHDFNMFPEDDVDGLLNEEKPDRYPCSPLIIGAHQGIFYLDTENVIIQFI